MTSIFKSFLVAMVLISLSLKTIDALRGIPNSHSLFRQFSLNQSNRLTPKIEGVFAGISAVTLVAVMRKINIQFNAADSVLRAFEEGRGLEAFKDTDDAATIDRQDLVDLLMPILQPKSSGPFVAVVGEKGTGKSTIVRKTFSSLEVPKGTVYFNCPESTGKFSTDLAALIGYRRQVNLLEAMSWIFQWKSAEDKSPNPGLEPCETFAILRQPLLDAAVKFKSKHGRPMVLVIDAVDLLAKRDPAFLVILQDFAKLCADLGHLRFVFVSSDGSALPLMMAQGSWSRAEKPLFEIGEIPDDLAVEYLTSRGVGVDEAKIAVANLTGGLFVALQDFSTARSKGQTYEQFAEQMDTDLEARLLVSKIASNHALFLHLVKHQSIRKNEALKLGMEQPQLDQLLKNNVLAAHPNWTYTFHDRHTATWFNSEVTMCEAVVQQRGDDVRGGR
jgi:ABC-type oligopeptide transport system ATPase subunit